MGLCLIKTKPIYCSFVGGEFCGGNRSYAPFNLPPAFGRPFSEDFETCFSKQRAHFWGDPGLPSDDQRPQENLCITPQSSCHFHFTQAFLCICLSSYPWLRFSLLLKRQRDEIRQKSEHPCAKRVSLSGQSLNPEEKPVEVGWER